MKLASAIGMILIGCGFIATNATSAAPLAAAPSPATQPSTQPSTQPAFDARATMALLDSAGGVYTSIHEAVEKGDLDTAKQLSEDLLKQSEDFRASVKGTPLVGPVNIGLTQLQHLHDALAEKDAEKA